MLEVSSIAILTGVKTLIGDIHVNQTPSLRRVFIALVI